MTWARPAWSRTWRPPSGRHRLRAWVAEGAHVEAASTDAALYMRWRHALAHRLAAHPVFAALHEPHGLAPALAATLASAFDVPTAVGAGLARILAADGSASTPRPRRARRWRRWGAPPPAGRRNANPTPAGRADLGDLHVPAPLKLLPTPARNPDLAPDPASLDPARPPPRSRETTRPCAARADRPGSPHRPTAGPWRGTSGTCRPRQQPVGRPFRPDGRPSSLHFDDQHAAWADAAPPPSSPTGTACVPWTRRATAQRRPR